MATRREWLKIFGGGALAGLGSPLAAWADRIRILGGPGADHAYAVGQVSPDLQRFIGGVRAGDLRTHGSMMVLWLHGTPGPALAVATLEEARSRGSLGITEREQATVPELIVDNRSKQYILLLAGEILLGGKQNRVLNEDILLPPLSGPRNIGVYCVEQGRWSGRAASFDSKGTFAAPALRHRLMEKASQSQVWAEVDKYTGKARASSPTHSYQEVYEKPEVKDHLRQVEQAVDAQPAAGALGAAVFVGGTLTGLDLFMDWSLFARQWPKLLRAQAVESYGRPGGPAVDEKHARARVEALLLKTARAEGTTHGNAGVGQIFETRVDGLRAAALVFEGRVPHAAIL